MDGARVLVSAHEACQKVYFLLLTKTNDLNESKIILHELRPVVLSSVTHHPSVFHRKSLCLCNQRLRSFNLDINVR